MKKIFLAALMIFFMSSSLYSMGNKAPSFSDKTDVSFSAQKTGLAVRLTITLKNIGSKKIFCQFPSTKFYDFNVKDEKGNLIWQWSKDRLFVDVLQKISIDSGQSVSYSVDWNYRNNNGEEVVPGKYLASGSLLISPSGINFPAAPVDVLDDDLTIAGGYEITGKIALHGNDIRIVTDDGKSYLVSNDNGDFAKNAGKYVSAKAPIIENIPNSNDRKITIKEYNITDQKPE